MAAWERLVEVAQELEPDPGLRQFDDEELDKRVGAQAARVIVETATLIELLAEAVVRGVWARSGAKTPGQWLSWRIGLAPSTAREHVRVGLALRSLPQIRERFGAGTLSYSKVRAITRVADPASQDVLLSYADSCPADELERIIARTRKACRAGGIEADAFAQNVADPTEPASRVERVSRREVEGDATEIVVRLDSSDADRLWADLDWLASHGPEGGTLDSRRIEALLGVVAAARSAAPADGSGEDRDRLVVEALEIPVPARRGTKALPQKRLVASVAGARSPSMSPRALRRLSCTATRVTPRLDDHGCTLDLGRSQRAPSTAQRRVILRRDKGCRFPGCGATGRLHVHHAVEWEHDGPTDLDNLVMLCAFHHRFVHNADWQVVPEGHGRFLFLDTSGEPVAPAASAEAPGELPIVRHHETVKADQLRPRWWQGDRIDWDLCIAVLAAEFERRQQRQSSGCEATRLAA